MGQIHRGCSHSKGLKPKYDHSTHPLWHKHEHKHGHGHGQTVGAAMSTASAGGGGRRYVCYQSCCVEHSSIVAFDSGFVESEFDVSCESEWSTCGAHHHHH